MTRWSRTCGLPWLRTPQRSLRARRSGRSWPGPPMSPRCGTRTFRGLRGPRGLRDLRDLGDLRRAGPGRACGGPRRSSPALQRRRSSRSSRGWGSATVLRRSPRRPHPAGGDQRTDGLGVRDVGTVRAEHRGERYDVGQRRAGRSGDPRLLRHRGVRGRTAAGPRVLPVVDRLAEAAAAAALRLLSARRPADPDYVSLWPSSIELRLTVSGSLATVDATAWPTNPAPGTSRWPLSRSFTP